MYIVYTCMYISIYINGQWVKNGELAFSLPHLLRIPHVTLQFWGGTSSFHHAPSSSENKSFALLYNLTLPSNTFGKY